MAWLPICLPCAMSDEEPHSTSPTRKWVWRCTDESIAAGQVSVLAVVETLLVVIGYWALVWYYDWPWPMLISLLAAPMLLLRSEQSVALGVRWLQEYGDRAAESITWLEKALIVVGTGLVTGLVCYWLAHNWLPTHVGWALFWRGAGAGAGAAVLAIAVTLALVYACVGGLLTHVATIAGTIAGAMVAAFVGAVTGTVAGTVAVAGMVAVAGIIAGGVAVVVAIEVAGAVTPGNGDLDTSPLGAKIVMVLGTPAPAVGLIARTQLIRLCATLRHPLQGLKQLPANWRITLWGIDPGHLPELLPQAGRVKEMYTLRGIWADLPNDPVEIKLTTITITPFWYLPALAYRWSLKASAWLWWPLVLALSHPLALTPADEQDGDARRQAATTVAWNRDIAILAAVILVWFLATQPDLAILQPLLPEAWFKLAAKLPPPPPPHSLRAILAYTGFALALLLFIFARSLKGHSGKALENPADFHNMTGKDRRVFLREAKAILRLRLLLIATIVLWGYATVLGIMHQRYPAELARFDWLNWLWPIL